MSYESSYSLVPSVIDAIVEDRFPEAALTDCVKAPDGLLLVAEDDAGGGVDVEGFVEAIPETR